MNDQKRLLLFFVIAIGFLSLWNLLFYKPPVKPPAEKPTAVRPQPAAQPKVPPPAPTALAWEQGAKAEEITVEKDLYRITFSTQGAVIKGWVLKRYPDEQDKPLEVVNQAACDQLSYPMGVTLDDAGLADRLNSAVYVAKKSARQPTGELDQLEFDYSDGHMQARKVFHFGHAYEIHVEASVSDGARYLPVGLGWPGGFGDHSIAPELASVAETAFYQTTLDERIVTDHITQSILSRWFGSGAKAPEQVEVRGSLRFAGLEDSYFADVFLPDSPASTFQANRQVWTPADWKGPEEKKPRPMKAILATAEPAPLGFRLFVGPKDLDVLRAVNPPVNGLVDFGWFRMVAEPLFIALRYLYVRWVHNYGWAIVVLTLLLNLAMFPLKLSSVKSAQRMQKVSPIIKEIQERYKQYK